MTALAYSEFHYQGALAQECVNLSSQCNAESGIRCKPLRAGPVAPCRVVVALANGASHYLRTMPYGKARQTPAELPYTYSEGP